MYDPYSHGKIGQKHISAESPSILIGISLTVQFHLHTDDATELIFAGVTKLTFFTRRNTDTFPFVTDIILHDVVWYRDLSYAGGWLVFSLELQLW